MNIGDGAAFILAKRINVNNANSRIGNPDSQGVAYCRGAADSPNKPDNVTNIGGSTILICAEAIANFNPAIISKYRTMTDNEISNGKVDTNNFRGLARAYIALNYQSRRKTPPFRAGDIRRSV